MNLFRRLFHQKRSSTSSLPISKQQFGIDGEKEAAQFLKKSGFKILVPRYRCRFGEVDLVARERETLVFVEVKTRRSRDFGEPAQAVTLKKQQHISRVALDYLRQLKNPKIPVRFDIVEVISSGEDTECQHIRDAFPLSEPYIY